MLVRMEVSPDRHVRDGLEGRRATPRVLSTARNRQTRLEGRRGGKLPTSMGGGAMLEPEHRGVGVVPHHGAIVICQVYGMASAVRRTEDLVMNIAPEHMLQNVLTASA